VEIIGPAVIEEVDSTTLVHPGQRMVVHPYGILILDVDI
jgi:N-methylhydantoinase A/oxoprolinase/acetone carboxylase beta subunit